VITASSTKGGVVGPRRFVFVLLSAYQRSFIVDEASPGSVLTLCT